MRTMTALSWAMIAALGVGPARAQQNDLPMPRTVDSPAATTPAPNPAMPTPNGLAEPGHLSNYILYDKLDCCGPLGGHGTINLEVFVRNGFARPITGGDVLNHRLQTGWIIEGGARSLFFDADQTAAWTVELGLINISNNGNRDNLPVLLRDVPIPNPDNNPFDPNDEVILGDTVVTIRALNRTYATLGVGREWFFPLPGFQDLANGRWGVDAGGRWGTSNLQLNDPSQTTSNFRRITDVIGSAYLAVHADVEIPCDFGIITAGLRGEWNYTWADWFLGLDNDFQELNLLFTVGVRF